MTADTGPLGGPNCYNCVFRRDLPGDAHSACANTSARVSGSRHGIRMGWFFWPFNFDPIWLEACDGYSARKPVEASVNQSGGSA